MIAYIKLSQNKSISIKSVFGVKPIYGLGARASFCSLEKRQLGFTLIEIMVVMVILGLATGMAVMSFGGGKQERELQNEVNRLHAVLRFAAEEAIFSNEEIGVVIEEDHYDFVISDENRSWSSIEKKPLTNYPIPGWISLDFLREGEKRELVKRTQIEEFDGESNILDREEVSVKPSITLFSSGEVTGFTIGMQIKNNPDSRVEIRSNDQDEIILPAQEERENE